MRPQTAGKSTLGSCGDLPLEAQLAEGGGAGRMEIAARLTAEMERLGAALANAPPDVCKEGMLLVECLRAARRVVERSVSFINARDK